ncbi:hypothetical protein C4D60_Mb10t27610 [Musa balbisiana]|uniref:Uncharacterized protein n=1 Tax=Musa balbisiana TaxID=52838 RepID=A0A4S8J2Q5_MUSBA|nr:hypothetical protein C4D60_Mb10t27610 [Musa balbisiana]
MRLSGLVAQLKKLKDSNKCLCCCYRSNAMPQPLSTCPESDASSPEKTSPMNVEALAMVPPCMQ